MDGCREFTMEFEQTQPLAGATEHGQLYGRDEPDQHPISSISGLTAKLEELGQGEGTVAEELARHEADPLAHPDLFGAQTAALTAHINNKANPHQTTAADVGAEEWATVKMSEAVPEITDEATFRTYFYNLRKSAQRKYQFEVTEGGIHDNIVAGVGGRPQGADAADSAFIYVDLPYSEAGGYIIHVTYELRSKRGLWHKDLYATLDSRWQDTGWYKPTYIAKTVIAPHGSTTKADMTASQIINAARRGVVLADYTDPATDELRTYQYFKQMPDGRAVFAVNGYIEAGVPKQTLIYVDYAGNVTTETRDGLSLGITGASVGQMIRIKSVDEQGRPTAFEAVSV